MNTGPTQPDPGAELKRRGGLGTGVSPIYISVLTVVALVLLYILGLGPSVRIFGTMKFTQTESYDAKGVALFKPVYSEYRISVDGEIGNPNAPAWLQSFYFPVIYCIRENSTIYRMMQYYLINCCRVHIKWEGSSN